jgi:hypothetical protein
VADKDFPAADRAAREQDPKAVVRDVRAVLKRDHKADAAKTVRKANPTPRREAPAAKAARRAPEENHAASSARSARNWSNNQS